MKKIFYAILTLLVVSSAFSIDNWTLHENLKYNYSLYFPSDWSIAVNDNMVIFKSMEPDSITENVSIMVQDLSKEQYDLEGYTELSLNQVDEILHGVIIDKGDTIIDNWPTYFVVYTMDYTENEGKEDERVIKLKLKQWWFIDEKSKRAILITYTAHLNTYGYFIEMVEHMVRLFDYKGSNKNK